MAYKDTTTKKYMRKPSRFADFFNGYIYKGEEVIKASDLSEVDTSNIAIIPSVKGRKKITVQKYRDILKKAILMKSEKAYYLFVGIENQSDIHYAMPVRNMLYDALVYNQQIEEISSYNKENVICETSGEFLSGFTKNDKLIPVVTVTVYWGSKPWDAPVTLKEMFVDVDDNLEQFLSDYNCNLFSIIDAQKLPKYRTELDELFNILKSRNDKDKLVKIVHSKDSYQSVDEETVTMINEFAGINISGKSKGGTYNVCKAIEDLKAEGREEGIKDGQLMSIKNVMLNGKMTFEEACKLLGIEDPNKYKDMVIS